MRGRLLNPAPSARSWGMLRRALLSGPAGPAGPAVGAGRGLRRALLGSGLPQATAVCHMEWISLSHTVNLGVPRSLFLLGSWFCFL